MFRDLVPPKIEDELADGMGRRKFGEGRGTFHPEIMMLFDVEQMIGSAQEDSLVEHVLLCDLL